MQVLSIAVLAACAGATLAASVDRFARADVCAGFSDEEKCMDEAPEADNCVWGPATPGDYDQALYTCQTRSCATIAYGTQEMDTQTECKNMPECQFHAEIQFCGEKGKNPPCTLYYSDGESEKCPSFCEWSEAAEHCLDKGAPVPCDMVYDKTKCTGAGCEYLSDIYKCWEKGKDVPCAEYAFAEQDLCPATCKWVVYSQSAGTDGECMNPGDEPACETFSMSEDGAMCPPDRCKFYPEMSLCWSSDKEVPCDMMKGFTCAQEGRCQWYAKASEPGIPTDGEGSCDTCPGGKTNCVSHYNGPTPAPAPSPDTGKACSSYTGNSWDCPEPRCFMDYDGHGETVGCGGGGVNGEECRDPTCADAHYEDDICAAIKGCTYIPNTGMCEDTSKPFPCNEEYFQDECASEKTCSWQAGENTASGTLDGFCYNTGLPIPCLSYRDPTICPSNCKWNEPAFACEDDSYKPNCVEYDAEGDCPPEDGCAWQNGICWEEGKTLPCSRFCTAFECDNDGACVFDQQDYTCGPCEGGKCPTLKACDTYTKSATCPSSACQWIPDDETASGGDATGTCDDKVCAEVNTATECNAMKGCGWDAIDAYGGECSLKGYDAPCNKIYDPKECTDAGCVFDEDADVENGCTEKGNLPGCHTASLSDCGKAGGEFVECEVDSNSECVVKSSLEPNTPPPLPGKGDGTGNEDESKCKPADYDKVKAKLEEAETECVIVGRRNRRGTGATTQQLECLAYFLEQAPNPTTVANACPCLWLYAKEVSPWETHWMEIKC